MVAIPPGDYGAQHVLLNFHGNLPGGEIWSVGLRTGAANPGAQELRDYAGYASRLFSSLWRVGASAIAALNPIGVTFTGVTARLILVNGVTQYVAEAPPEVATNGSQSAQTSPNQVAVAVSLRTPVAGKHGRGRIYLPILCPQFDPGGKLTTVFQNGIRDFARDLISGLNTIKPAGTGTSDPPSRLWPMSVQSRTSGVTGPPITSIQVGDVADTIRGRRNRLLEVYVSGTVEQPVI